MTLDSGHNFCNCLCMLLYVAVCLDALCCSGLHCGLCHIVTLFTRLGPIMVVLVLWHVLPILGINRNEHVDSFIHLNYGYTWLGLDSLGYCMVVLVWVSQVGIIFSLSISLSLSSISLYSISLSLSLSLSRSLSLCLSLAYSFSSAVFLPFVLLMVHTCVHVCLSMLDDIRQWPKFQQLPCWTFIASADLSPDTMPDMCAYVTHCYEKRLM